MPTVSYVSKPIAELLGLAGNSRSVLALIGSGGKTSLAWLLARRFRHERVLVTTSTKMELRHSGGYDYFPDARELVASGDAPAGITFAGIPISDDKVEALPLAELEGLFQRFDKVFVEADGSRRRSYKGWGEHEPVLPGGLDATVAVIPVPARGARVNEDTVHRLPLFLEISGALPGQEINAGHLASVIAHPQGLLGKVRGKAALFFNQADDAAGIEFAAQVAALLPAECRERIWRIVAGSVQNDSGVEL